MSDTRRITVVTNADSQVVGWFFRCPACLAADAGSGHMVTGQAGWRFDGDFEHPTFEPSIRATCTLGEEERPYVCHSFVRRGRIQYCEDSTHAFAGQTIELPPVWSEP